jgi:hypothetical protein
VASSAEFIADGGERGRMVLQITASGGRASSQLQALRNAGYVEYWDDPDNPAGRIVCASPSPARGHSPQPAQRAADLYRNGDR